MKKRLITGGLTALLAAGLILPTSASAAGSDSSANDANSYWKNIFNSIPWEQIFKQLPVQNGQNGNIQFPGGNNGTPQKGTDQTGDSQDNAQQNDNNQNSTTDETGNTDNSNVSDDANNGDDSAVTDDSNSNASDDSANADDSANSGNTNNSGNTGTSDNSGSNTQQGTLNAGSEFAAEVINLVNQERAKQGLKPLAADEELNNMALAKAKDMSQNNYFDHTSPTYGSPFQMMSQFGISYSYAGENIAMGQKTPADVVNAWMNSEGHRANILNANYTLIGVGYYNGYWAQEFVGR
ncbi:CAP domain-containing protein [Paenibacillus sp. M1]|uniref:CAP domain-containing protein n=2 Tax=Paenibacillus haidiansis TaxID=1574488 RepID=A0ABU7VSY6_9BACL